MLKLIFCDNGIGICYEELASKFKQFYESQKNIANDRGTDLTRGKNGYGCFTFHKFARLAKWKTLYRKGEDIISYDISISNDNLKDYTPTPPTKSKLKTERSKLSNTKTLEGVMEEITNNSATMSS